jgi:hypothetical protein
MAPRRVPPPAAAPRARAAPPPPAVQRSPPRAGATDQISRDLAGLNVTSSTPFNFNAQFPSMTIGTTSLDDGKTRVIIYYLIPTMSSSRVVLETSSDGKCALFSLRLPPGFVDVASRLELEVASTVQDKAVYASAYRSHQDVLLQAHPDIYNIMTQVQRDPLPFVCEQSPTITLLLLEGDPELQAQLRLNGDNNHQYMAVARAIFRGSDVQRFVRNHGMQVLRSPVAAANPVRFQQPPPAAPPVPPPQGPQTTNQQYAQYPAPPGAAGRTGAMGSQHVPAGLFAQAAMRADRATDRMREEAKVPDTRKKP